MPGIISPTRSDGIEIMAVLEALTDYTCEKHQNKRTNLCMIGGSNTAVDSEQFGYYRNPMGNAGPSFSRLSLQKDATTGKVGSALMYYLQRETTTVDTRPSDACATVAPRAHKNELYDATSLTYTGNSVTVNAHSLQRMLKGTDDFAAEQILSFVDSILVKMDINLMAGVIAGQGGNVEIASNGSPTITDLTTYPKIPMYSTGNGTVVGPGVHDFQQAVEANEMNNSCMPFVITDTTSGFSSYLRAEKLACCNDAGFNGMGASSVLGVDAMRSPSVKRAFELAGIVPGTHPTYNNASILIQPGASHLIEVYDHLHEGMRDGDGISGLFSWTDPISGELFDLRVQRNVCGFDIEYTFHLYKQYKAVTLPTDLFASGDTLENVNGILLYDFTPAA